jgi:hypothetical protein
MTRARRATRWIPGDQAGSVSLFLVVAVLAVFIADDTAAEAARAAVQSVQPASTVRGEAPRVDATAAIYAAQQYLRRAGITGTVSVIGDRVRVTTSSSFSPAFLSLIGLGTQTVAGRAEARLARGVSQEQP